MDHSTVVGAEAEEKHHSVAEDTRVKGSKRRHLCMLQETMTGANLKTDLAPKIPIKIMLTDSMLDWRWLPGSKTLQPYVISMRELMPAPAMDSISKKMCVLSVAVNVLITFDPFYSPCLRWAGKKSKVLPEPNGPLGGADLRFLSPQPDTSLHCETTDMGLVYVRCACLLLGFCWYSLRLHTEGWPGWVDTGCWLHT